MMLRDLEHAFARKRDELADAGVRSIRFDANGSGWTQTYYLRVRLAEPLNSEVLAFTDAESVVEHGRGRQGGHLAIVSGLPNSVRDLVSETIAPLALPPQIEWKIEADDQDCSTQGQIVWPLTRRIEKLHVKLAETIAEIARLQAIIDG